MPQAAARRRRSKEKAAAAPPLTPARLMAHRDRPDGLIATCPMARGPARDRRTTAPSLAGGARRALLAWADGVDLRPCAPGAPCQSGLGTVGRAPPQRRAAVEVGYRRTPEPRPGPAAANRRRGRRHGVPDASTQDADASQTHPFNVPDASIQVHPSHRRPAVGPGSHGELGLDPPACGDSSSESAMTSGPQAARTRTHSTLGHWDRRIDSAHRRSSWHRASTPTGTPAGWLTNEWAGGGDHDREVVPPCHPRSPLRPGRPARTGTGQSPQHTLNPHSLRRSPPVRWPARPRAAVADLPRTFARCRSRSPACPPTCSAPGPAHGHRQWPAAVRRSTGSLRPCRRHPAPPADPLTHPTPGLAGARSPVRRLAGPRAARASAGRRRPAGSESLQPECNDPE